MEGFLGNMESLPGVPVGHPSDMGSYPGTTESLPKSIENLLLNMVRCLRNIESLSRKTESHPLNMASNSRTTESPPSNMDGFASK